MSSFKYPRAGGAVSSSSVNKSKHGKKAANQGSAKGGKGRAVKPATTSQNRSKERGRSKPGRPLAPDLKTIVPGLSAHSHHHHKPPVYEPYLDLITPPGPVTHEPYVPDPKKNPSDDYLWTHVELHPVKDLQQYETFNPPGLSKTDVLASVGPRLRRQYSLENTTKVPTIVSTHMGQPNNNIPDYLLDSMSPAERKRVLANIAQLNIEEDQEAARQNIKLFGTDFANLNTYKVQTEDDLKFEKIIKKSQVSIPKKPKTPPPKKDKPKTPPPPKKTESKIPPPKKTKSKTPPPKKAKSKTPPPKKSKSKTPPPPTKSKSKTPPPPTKSKSKTPPPPTKSKSKTPPPKKSKSKTPPPTKSKSKTPPPKKSKSKTGRSKTPSKANTRQVFKKSPFPPSSKSSRPPTPRKVVSSVKRTPVSRPASAKPKKAAYTTTYSSTSDFPRFPTIPKFPKSIVLPTEKRSERKRSKSRAYSSSEESEEGLCFEFRPVSPCAAEISITIEPVEDECPLEYAVNNGIMPIVCCMMPPSYGMPANGSTFGSPYSVFCQRPNYC